MSISFDLKDCCYDCKWFSPGVVKNVTYCDDGKTINTIDMVVNCNLREGCDMLDKLIEKSIKEDSLYEP